jgi:hypothetical protein
MDAKDLDNQHLKDQLPPAELKAGINTRAIMKSSVVLVVIIIATHLLLWVLFNYFDQKKKAADIEVSPLAPKQDQLPPGPRLQAVPNETGPDARQVFEPMNVLDYQNQERETLSSYGWVDEKNGIVRIPIDRAIELLVERYQLPQESPLVQPPNRENAVQQ